MPFRIEKEHAEYISIFVRILGELGKTNELKFYVGELEKLQQRGGDPIVSFTLAVVYLNLSEARPEAAKKMLEEVIADPTAIAFHSKAKMFLANYYDRFRDDTAACRQIIDSIEEENDPSLRILVDIWKAKLLRDEQRFEEAETLLAAILQGLDAKKDWYAYYTAQIVRAILYLRQGKADAAAEIVDEVRRRFEGRNFKSLQIQLAALEKQLEKETTLGVIEFIPGELSSTFVYSSRKLTLKKETPAEKLLVLLARKRYLDKAGIARNLYERPYDGVRDDKRIYYHIHSLRKRLRQIGLPAEAITNDGAGYRLVPKVKTVGSKVCS
jgi:tetratricopeptide (TPR) repeat protein